MSNVYITAVLNSNVVRIFNSRVKVQLGGHIELENNPLYFKIKSSSLHSAPDKSQVEKRCLIC